MRKLAKRGRRWREKLLEGKPSGQDHDECVDIIFSQHSLGKSFLKTYKMQNQRATTHCLGFAKSFVVRL